MSQETIENFWNLPGLLGIGILSLEGQTHFYVKPQIQDWEKLALLDLMVQNISKSSSRANKIEFAVMGYHAFVFQGDLFIKIAILTQTNLVNLPRIEPLIASIKSDLRSSLNFLDSLAKKAQSQPSHLTSKTTSNLGQASKTRSNSTDVNVRELIDLLNKISQNASKYLGTKRIVGYLELTRPQSEDLHDFNVKESGEVIFSESALPSGNPLQNQSIENWISAFIGQSSQVLPYLSTMLEQNLNEREKTILLSNRNSR